MNLNLVFRFLVFQILVLYTVSDFVFFRRYIMSTSVFGPCSYNEDCSERKVIFSIVEFVCVNVLFELIVCKNLWSLQMFVFIFIYIYKVILHVYIHIHSHTPMYTHPYTYIFRFMAFSSLSLSLYTYFHMNVSLYIHYVF